jgi:thioredoxin-dependent peroxiredoxin
MTELAVGRPLPPAALTGDEGQSLDLAGLKGRKAVLFFYPKADTSGCTLEAKDFSRLKPEFDRAGVALLGISADPVKAIRKFRSKHDLAVPLATDPERGLIEALGLWVEKSLYGRKYMGIERTTILLDDKGVVRRLWPKVKIEGHAEEVLEAARSV